MTETPIAPAAVAGGSGNSAVELRNITKRFPGVVANDDVSLAVESGEILCLLGENGAGKSTLMAMLAGMLRPDEGAIEIAGRAVEIDSPRHAIELGIGMVYQHSTLIPELTILQNLMLGESRALKLPVEQTERRLAELSALLGVEVDSSSPAADLALGEQQQVEIIKALWRSSEVLILDEPTSMLTPAGVAELQRVLVRLKARGVAIVFITHKLHEALAIGDRIAILKRGRVVASLGEEDLRGEAEQGAQQRIVAAMFGEEEEPDRGDVPELREAEPTGHRVQRRLPSEITLELEQATVTGGRGRLALEDVTFAVRAGEILGVAGVDGNGQKELAEAIAGQRKLEQGRIRLHGSAVDAASVAAREHLGVRYVTDDRLGEAIAAGMSVAMNLVLKRVGQEPFWRRGRVQPRMIDQHAAELVERFDVRTPSLQTRVSTLSGGNIQKVLLARELAFDPRVVVYNKPTYGLDVRTIAVVRRIIREQAAAGVSAVLISTELDELLELCDRVAVMSRGRIVGLVDNEPGIAERIGEMMIGGAPA